MKIILMDGELENSTNKEKQLWHFMVNRFIYALRQLFRISSQNTTPLSRKIDCTDSKTDILKI